MDAKRIHAIALAECPDEQEIIYLEQIERCIRTAVNEFAAEAIADMVRPNEEAGSEHIARAVAQKRIRDLLP